MNRIEKLIEELCPNGVEYKPLGEVARIYRGKRFVKADMQESGIPCIHYGEIYTKYGTSATESISYLSEVRAKSLRFAHPNDVVMATAGETIEDIGKSVAWLGNEPIVIHDACYVISGEFDPKFTAYYFNSKAFKDQIRNKISSSKISSISTKNVAKTLFPILPIRIQEEISKTLELFEALEAELEARKKQYEFYRDQLLTFTERERERVRWSPLSDLCFINRGKVISKDYLAAHKGPFPVFSSQTANAGVFGCIDSYDYDFESITWTTDGANAGSVFYHSEAEKFSITNVCGLLRVKYENQLLTKYLYFYLIVEAKRHVSTGMGNPKLMSTAMKQIQIPIPPLEEQQRIVNILDKFDALVNDLTSGLPAEIEARRKQYEYYRDELLTFKELAA
ncbi:restriction endonuclease subunit S [Corynebacterium diphtheriae]|uniref:restriction endonuclease subunit S n=1 Tax=Corynebacterium diphtheriae TaxID=1717 RepID=UPI000B4B6495|nr:restriction endonuclease subunit S [Corynebacterium diphtheriae]OWO65553.1 hypothetical protein AY483_09530 [Corynebacterium diphtheriae bv. mitis]